LRQGWQSSLQGETGQDYRAADEAEVGLERAGSIEAKTLKRGTVGGLKRPRFNALTVKRITQVVVVIPTNDASVTACYGSPKTQNIQDALTHAQSSEPLARCASEQVLSVRKQRPLAHRLPIVRLLPQSTGVDARKQVTRKLVEALNH